MFNEYVGCSELRSEIVCETKTMDELKALCNYMQEIDPNGFYYEIVEEVKEGSLSLDAAFSEIAEIQNEWD